MRFTPARGWGDWGLNPPLHPSQEGTFKDHTYIVFKPFYLKYSLEKHC